MEISKPDFLYHGSPKKVDLLTPRPASGVGPEKDRLCAVYASHIKNVAIAFALPIFPGRNGAKSMSISYSDQWIPKIRVKKGYIDTDGCG